MRCLTLSLLFLTVALTSPPLRAEQGKNWPHPPEAADKAAANADAPAPTVRVKIDRLQLQREARELLELSQSLQPDIDSISHGLLPKDTIEKLKRLEKLSKHLRKELAQ